MIPSEATKQRMDLNVVWESRHGSVRRMHVSDIPTEEKWVNLKLQ